MKSLRLAAALGALSLALFASTGSAGSVPRLVPHQGPQTGDSANAACFDVYCDGVDSGWTVCGNELGPIIDVAVGICNPT